MTNEEFQILVLQELKGIKSDIGDLKTGQKRLEDRQSILEEGQKRIENKLDAVYEQTAILTEFRTEVNMKLDSLIEDNKSIHEMLGEHEISIRTLRRRPV